MVRSTVMAQSVPRKIRNGDIDIFIIMYFNIYLRPRHGAQYDTNRFSPPSRMTHRTKLLTTLSLLVLLGALGAADYFLTDNEYASLLPSDEELQPTTAKNEEEPASEGVAKQTGPDVRATIEEQNLTAVQSSDLTLLTQIVTDEEVHSYALLRDGDRVGSVTWVESPGVKQLFIALKEALLPAFSSGLMNLKDTTLLEEGKPIRNLLTFMDPSISEEQMVFVRVRERLFEFQISSEQEDAMQPLIDALTTR